MDRLLVGDVGYGKTEVAVRAAFKAVMDGHQVALLAPDDRAGRPALRDLPPALRAVPGAGRDGLALPLAPPRSARCCEDVELGAVDVLIGTHRLLSKDVRFKQLGLLVVDEEQRFGVAHKERLKQHRRSASTCCR